MNNIIGETLELFLFGCGMCGLLAFFGLVGEIVSWMLDD